MLPTGLEPFSAATVYEAAGFACLLPIAISPLDDRWKVCGRARTVATQPGHNLSIHRAIYRADPGDILMVSTGGGYEYGYLGAIMATAAVGRGLGGVVIDGCVRDVADLRTIGLPVFSRGRCVRGTGKSGDTEVLGTTIMIGDVAVADGDIVVGDLDGVVVVPAAQAGEVADRARARVASEAEILRRISDGATTLDLFGWS